MAIDRYIPQIKRATRDDAIGAMEAANREGSLYPSVPSHVLTQGGEYIGYWGINTIPLVLAWHKKTMNARQTLYAFSSVDAIMSDRGNPVYIVPLEPDSPYCPLMEKLGFSEMGDAKLYIKEK